MSGGWEGETAKEGFTLHTLFLKSHWTCSPSRVVTRSFYLPFLPNYTQPILIVAPSLDSNLPILRKTKALKLSSGFTFLR